MGNLQRQIADIKKTLAVSTAESIMRFRNLEMDMTELRKGAEEQAARFRRVETGLTEMRQALEDESQVQQAALGALLDLVLEHTQAAASKAEVEAHSKVLQEILERVARLEEQRRPPAA